METAEYMAGADAVKLEPTVKMPAADSMEVCGGDYEGHFSRRSTDAPVKIPPPVSASASLSAKSDSPPVARLACPLRLHPGTASCLPLHRQLLLV